MKKIGVFICWCGSNIADVVSVDKVLAVISKHPGVAHCEYYKYFCSEPGQRLVEDAIKNKSLDAIVIAACSPSMHEATFRKAAERAGLNRYQCEITNIREQCSWVHRMKKGEATQKAIDLISGTIEKLKLNESLQPITTPVTKRALVIGGGITGMQAALDIANAGVEVVLLERAPSVGGHMSQLAETFPTLDCSQCILTPRTVEIAQHPKIKLITYAELEELSGYLGNYTAKIRKKAAYIDRVKCTGCGLCIEKCPKKIPSEFDLGSGQRKAVYILYPQAVPNKPVIDPENCMYLLEKKCGICQKVCEVKAVDYEQKDEIIEEKVGCVVVATGYDLYPVKDIAEYGNGRIKDVIDGLQFERLNSASGPTSGAIVRPSNGDVPKDVVFIQCTRSRDPEKGVSYCPGICCMYTGKHAMLYKRKVPDGQAYVFYMDIRAPGKDYEEFIQRGIEEERTLYIRGRVARLYEENGKVIVCGIDTLTGKIIEIKADLVVLATAMLPRATAKDLAKKLNISTDEYGFYREAHVKLKPVQSNTMGIFLAGCCQGPKDIPYSVSQAGSAASKVLALFGSDKLSSEPIVATVDESLCAACGVCVANCPYNAREIDEKRKVAVVKEMLCQGCGACVAVCPNKACQLKNMTTEQVMSIMKELE